MGLPSWLETSRKHAKALIDDACCRPKRESSKGGPKYEEGESDSTKEGSNEEDLRGHGVQVPLSDGNSLAVNSPEQDAEDEPVLKSENKFGGHSQELMDAKVDVTRTDGDETPLNKLVAPIASVDGDDSRKGMDSDGLGHFGTIVSDTAATAEANSDMQPSISSNDDHLSDKIATANSAQPIDNDSDNEASVPASVPDAPAEERNSDGCLSFVISSKHVVAPMRFEDSQQMTFATNS
ncbi:hypothetical protein BJ742DRAFT_397714 [Cladochytrium replicatum]|nr:hypothetical protein BJ742DRAFT_397714 [Cladochytrium replicatum]